MSAARDRRAELPPSPTGALPRAFFERDTRTVARELLGMRLCHRLPDNSLRSARIVETEAYHGFDDRASHAHRGPTPRNAVMFGPAGHAYVYLCYGIHHLLNFVTGAPGFPAAVLIRGVDRPEGFDDYAIGPGRLCKAMALRRELHDGMDLCSTWACARPPSESNPAPPQSLIWVEAGGVLEERVRTSPRIGVDYAGSWANKPWRYYLSGTLAPGLRAVSQRPRRG